MGGLNFLGLGGGTPKPIGGSGTKPSMSNYKFGDARKTKIRAGKGTFDRQVSDVKWKKMVRSGGKKDFKLLRGEKKGEVIKDVDLKKEVGKILKQRAGRGITGKELKMKLVRKVGMGFKDAEVIARAATLRYYEPPAEGGISDKDALINARAGLRSAEMVDNKKQSAAGQLLDRGKKTKEDIAKKKGDSTDINAQKREYKVGMGQEEIKDVREESGASADIQSGEKSTFSQSGKETVGVGGSHQPTKAEKETAAPHRETQQTVPLSGGSGGITNPPSNILGISGGPERHELSALGGLVNKNTGKGDIINQLRDEYAADEKATENDNEEGDESLSEEEAAKTASVDDEESALNPRSNPR